MARVTIPDETYQRFEAAAAASKLTTEELIARQLTRFVDHPISTRVVVLSGAQLEELEILLGGGHLQSPKALFEKVKGLAGVTIGNIRLPFNAAQLEEIGHRAQRQGKTPKQVCEDIVAQMAEQFFYGPVVSR